MAVSGAFLDLNENILKKKKKIKTNKTVGTRREEEVLSVGTPETAAPSIGSLALALLHSHLCK